MFQQSVSSISYSICTHIDISIVQRVQFNAQKKDYEKITAPLDFPKELFMDRYSIQNRAETTKRREIVNQWRKQLKEVEQRIAGSMNYKVCNRFFFRLFSDQWL